MVGPRRRQAAGGPAVPLISEPTSSSAAPLRCAALVGIPTFQATSTIDATLASVEASIRFHRDAGSNDEVVISVVDDASADDTVSRVRRFAERSECVVLLAVQTVNRGRAAARNRALAAADAGAFLFLDHDDLFHPEHIHVCLDTLLSHPQADYVQTGVELSDPVHRDWASRIAASLTQNLCVRARCHQLIGGFHEEPEVEAYGCDDVLYNRTLHALFHGVRIPSTTVRFNRRPGNSFDRQYERKFRRPAARAEPTTSTRQRELAREVLALQQRRVEGVRRRFLERTDDTAGPANQSAPFDRRREPIFALLVTGKHAARAPLAQGAVASFLNQDYGNRFLVVVDDGERPLDATTVPAERALVIRPPGRRSLGYLRNLGLDAIPADALWTYWDDDDWRHPRQLTAQRKVLDTLGVPACLLTRQVKYSLIHDVAYVDHHPGGFAGTLMSRKHPTLRFPSVAASEDSAYLDALKKVWSWYPWNNPPHLMLRFFHGANTWGLRHFGLLHRPAGTWSLPCRSAEVLRRVLEQYRDQGVPVARRHDTTSQ